MQKKILAVAVAVLLFAFGAVACEKKDKIEEDSTYEPFEYTTDEAGEKYVTNIYGDLIPVTTSESGAVELIEDLVTKTKEQVEQEKAEQNAATDTNKEPAITAATKAATKGETKGEIKAGTAAESLSAVTM